MTTEIYEKSFEVSQPAKLTVNNIRGQVTITPGEDDRISIQITKHLDSGNPDLTTVKLIQDQGGAVSVKTEYDHKWLGFNRRPCRVEYQITVPSNCDLKVKNVSAHMHLQGIAGSFHLGSVSGRIDVENLSGRLRIKSVSGRLHGAGLEGPAELNSVSGNIDFEDCNFSSLDASTVSGKASIQTPVGSGPYSLSSVSGEISFVVPPSAACTVKAHSVSGRLYTDLPPTRQIISRRNWDFDLAGGGVPLNLHTVSGNIRVVTSPQSRGQQPSPGEHSSEDIIAILTKLEQGDISIKEAVRTIAD